MSISDASAQGEAEDTLEVTEVIGSSERQKLEREMTIEITKMTFCSEQTDDQIQDNDIEPTKSALERMKSLEGVNNKEHFKGSMEFLLKSRGRDQSFT